MTVMELIDNMTPEERRGALKALDAVTRPLRAREIEFALRQVGVPKSRAVGGVCPLWLKFSYSRILHEELQLGLDRIAGASSVGRSPQA